MKLCRVQFTAPVRDPKRLGGATIAEYTDAHHDISIEMKPVPHVVLTMKHAEKKTRRVPMTQVLFFDAVDDVPVLADATPSAGMGPLPTHPKVEPEAAKDEPKRNPRCDRCGTSGPGRRHGVTPKLYCDQCQEVTSLAVAQ